MAKADLLRRDEVYEDGVARLVTFILKRDAIRMAYEAGDPKPWTNDVILRDYKFCNVRREDDRVTKWIADNWRTPHADHPDLWFAMAVARWVNWDGTLAELNFPLPWNPKKFVKVLEARRAAGEKVWTGAYMIGTQGNAKDKPLFIAEDVLSPLWARRAELRPKPNSTLESFARPIINTKNQGTFMVGQIVADIKYVEPLLSAPDWDSWAVSGPGSRRGLNRVYGLDHEGGWNDRLFKDALDKLRYDVHSHEALPPWFKPLHAQDLQNCLCEFDKYERVRLGQGKPRSRYAGR